MTGWRKRQVLDMAREAWAESGEGWVVNEWFDDRSKAFEAFAALVREDERELCARIAEEWLGPTKDCELHIAAAIRAKGEQA